jgi:hypothetical protein
MELEKHWQFAFGAAVRRIVRWAKNFDFNHTANEHTYADSNPDRLLHLIDAFLADKSTKCLGGNRRQLEEIRPYVELTIRPVYRRGLAEGKNAWLKSNKVYGQLPNEQLHRQAWEAAAGEPELKDWFVEGYCFGFSQEEFHSLANKK